MSDVPVGARATCEIVVEYRPGCRLCATPNPDGLPTCGVCGAQMPPGRTVVTTQEIDLWGGGPR